MALGGLLPAVMSLPPAPFTPTLTQTTTPTQNAFLNDSWKPTTFVAPVVGGATDKLRIGSLGNNTTQNTTYAIYDFLNNSSVQPAASTPIYSVAATGNQIAWRGESIYQFLDDSWTPSTPVEAYKAGNYKMHQMN
jgi:hypothetical protein